MANFLLTGDALPFDTLSQAFQAKSTLELDPKLLNQKGADAGNLPESKAERSRNYLQAQAVTTGLETEESIIRLALLLLVHSQVREQANNPPSKLTLQRLLAFYNREVYPVVLQQGSEASRLAQLCQPLILAGKVRFQGYPLKASEVSEMFSWPALPLAPEEVQRLLAFPAFCWAQAADLLMHLKPLTNWYIYFDAVFAQVLPDGNAELHRSLRELTQFLRETQQAWEEEVNGLHPTVPLHTPLANLALTLQEAIQHLSQLNQVLLEGLEAMLEPPATLTFFQAREISRLLVLQAPRPAIVSDENFSTFLLLNTAENLLTQARELAALVFWSFVQADAVSGDFLESSTLRTYQEAGLFVPEETVNEQLAKVRDFIQNHIPISAA
ncbi:MAG: aromatic amino acid lyase [Adhaeribacter sp.]